MYHTCCLCNLFGGLLPQLLCTAQCISIQTSTGTQTACCRAWRLCAPFLAVTTVFSPSRASCSAIAAPIPLFAAAEDNRDQCCISHHVGAHACVCGVACSPPVTTATVLLSHHLSAAPFCGAGIVERLSRAQAVPACPKRPERDAAWAVRWMVRKADLQHRKIRITTITHRS